jgi:hypothetical protein
VLTFNMPIKDAWLVDDQGERTNVTRKIKKCAGPKHDFHGESVRIKDIFDIDLVGYPTLEVTNVFNQKREFAVHLDSLKHPLFL